MPTRIQQLNDLGQSAWLDFIRRDHLEDGTFDAMVKGGVLGVTSNPTIFQQALTRTSAYDPAIEQGVADGLDTAKLFDALAIEDIQMACDKLMPTFQGTRGLDGRVSIEVNPHLAHDTEGTVSEARRLHKAVGRPNVMIKIPATIEGLPAITACLTDGICINVTLIFSIARYEHVMDAYLTALERRLAARQPLEQIISVASFFVSRVDSKVDKAIEAEAAKLPAGDGRRAELESFRGAAAVANARLAYMRFRETFGAKRFEPLRAAGARVQRPLWASTSTKNPSYPDTLYVDELIGRDTVNTLPPATIDAFNQHGTVEARIQKDLDDARTLFERLPGLGVPVNDLIDQLEPEGVVAFEKSYDELIAAIESKRVAMKGSR